MDFRSFGGLHILTLQESGVFLVLDVSFGILAFFNQLHTGHNQFLVNTIKDFHRIGKFLDICHNSRCDVVIFSDIGSSTRDVAHVCVSENAKGSQFVAVIGQLLCFDTRGGRDI